MFLQMAENLEQVARIRISFRPEHADQAFRRCADAFAERGKSYRRLDVIAQHRLAGFHIAAQHRFDALAEQRFAKSWIAGKTRLDHGLEASRHRHFAASVVCNRPNKASHSNPATLAFAAAYSRVSRATSSLAGTTASTAPIPW